MAAASEAAWAREAAVEAAAPAEPAAKKPGRVRKKADAAPGETA